MKWVTFTAHELNRSCLVRLAGPVIPVEHWPEGWQQVQRMWRTSFTEWQGAPAWELQIPIVFDQLPFNPRTGQAYASVEKNIRNLELMAAKMPNKPRTPILKVDAKGAIPHDFTNDHNKQWVVAALAWGDYTINEELDRVRQEATVTVWQYVPDKIIQAKERLPARPVPKKYKIKPHDTLQKIAAYFYGDQAKWHDIAKLNKIRDPSHLKVHRVIKLPKASAR